MKILLRNGFLLSFFVLCSCYVSAETDEIQQLANAQTWLKLLKYEPSDETDTGWLSAIHADAFFLSQNGLTDPVAELNETIAQFTSPDNSLPENEHPTCRFPARYKWLSEQLEGKATFAPMADCQEYNNWILNGDTESISFVLATGYLANPASFYGHTVLKLNSSKNRNTKDIEDVSVNYGAIVPDGEDPITYIFKGIFGGYDAGFSDSEYYIHTHNYGENELRDIWEYEIDFSKDEVDFVLAHAWEVLGKEYTYYFFRKNCGYRMAELLELIPGVDIIPSNPVFVMPQVLIQNLSNSTRNGKSLVKNISRKQSRQSKLYESFFDLSAEETRQVKNIAENTDEIDSDGFEGLSDTEKSKVLEVLINYYLYLMANEPENENLDNNYRRVLAKRFALPSGKSLDSIAPKSPPHKGRNPTRISGGFAANSDIANSAILHIRPAYYDELDAEAAHVDNSSLSMAELKLAIYENHIDIKQLDIVAITSFNSKATNLPGDEMNTWGLRFGVRAQHLGCINCESGYFEAEFGKGLNLSQKTRVIFEAGGGLQDQQEGLGNLYGLVSGKLISHVTEDFSLKSQVQARYFYDGKTANDTKFSVSMRYRLDTNSDVRLSYESHHGNSIYLDWGVYF